MFARAPAILGAVAVFGLYESALMALLPIWGVRSGLTERMAAGTLSAVYFGSIVLQVLIGWLSDRVSRLAALRLCGAVGLVGAVALLSVPASPLVLFGLLFVWGGVASGIYPVALSMAGDRFRGGDLVSVNAAMIIAYGLGGTGRARRWAASRWISATRRGCCGCSSCCSRDCWQEHLLPYLYRFLLNTNPPLLSFHRYYLPNKSSIVLRDGFTACAQPILIHRCTDATRHGLSAAKPICRINGGAPGEAAFSGCTTYCQSITGILDIVTSKPQRHREITKYRPLPNAK